MKVKESKNKGSAIVGNMPELPFFYYAFNHAYFVHLLFSFHRVKGESLPDYVGISDHFSRSIIKVVSKDIPTEFSQQKRLWTIGERLGFGVKEAVIHTIAKNRSIYKDASDIEKRPAIIVPPIDRLLYESRLSISLCLATLNDKEQMTTISPDSTPAGRFFNAYARGLHAFLNSAREGNSNDTARDKSLFAISLLAETFDVCEMRLAFEVGAGSALNTSLTTDTWNEVSKIKNV